LYRRLGGLQGRYDTYNVLVEKPEATKPLGMLWHRWQDNIKIYITGI
jgi:hypothetical protein